MNVHNVHVQLLFNTTLCNACLYIIERHNSVADIVSTDPRSCDTMTWKPSPRTSIDYRAPLLYYNPSKIVNQLIKRHNWPCDHGMITTETVTDLWSRGESYKINFSELLQFGIIYKPAGPCSTTMSQDATWHKGCGLGVSHTVYIACTGRYVSTQRPGTQELPRHPVNYVCRGKKWSFTRKRVGLGS